MTVLSKKFDVADEGGAVEHKPFAGTLSGWYLEKTFGFTCVHGKLTQDKRERFPDNSDIRTSYLVEFYYNTETQTGWITTRNSRYELGAVRDGYPIERIINE